MRKLEQEIDHDIAKEINKKTFIRAMGIIGIIAVFITILSDIILLGKPTPGFSFFKLGTETMVGIASWRLTLGTFLGVFCLPFQTLALIPVYYGLKPAGKVKSVCIVIPAAYALLMGIAFHISYAYIGTGWNHYYENGALEMMKTYHYYWMILIVVMFAMLLSFSILFAYTISKGKTRYPKWIALFNPLCIVVVVLPLILILPAPVGGFVAPTILNLSTMIFMCFSTKVISDKI